jgi:hypothetical protein
MRSLQNKTILLLLIIIINHSSSDFFCLILPQTNTNKKQWKIIALFFIEFRYNEQTTTSSIKGTVKTSNAETLPGATVLAIHTQRDQSIPPCRMKMVDLICWIWELGALQSNRYFRGFQTQIYNEVYLELGKTNLDAILKEKSAT